MIFKNKKERPHWILALIYATILFSRLAEWDFEVYKWSRRTLVAALSVLVCVHVYTAIRWRRQGTLPS